MTHVEAILVRVSNRKYLDRALTEDEISQLNKIIDVANQASGLRMQLLTDCPEAFSSLRSSYGLFSGVRNMVALVGPEDLPDFQEKCGYYGQKVLLGATALGLGTCWVCGTYDRGKVPCRIRPGDVLCGVIAVGPVAPQPGTKERLIRSALHRGHKSAAELSRGLGDAPDWFQAGISAVTRAPSALNRQAYRFTYAGGSVTVRQTEHAAWSDVDLGIAKYQFEIGAHGGTWTWGDGGTFTKAKEEKSCGAVIWRMGEKGHEFLLAQHGASHWSFPKGHIEGRETELETARREILEETGLTVDIDPGFRQVVTYYPKPGVIKDVVFFIAQPTGGQEHPQLSEIRQLGWFPFQEAKPLVTFATDVEALKEAEAYILSKE